MHLTQKETSLLLDMKNQEKLCIEKYKESAEKACDPQLKNLFMQIEKAENQHLKALEDIEAGDVPEFSPVFSELPKFDVVYNGTGAEKEKDSFLCSDLLATEKHAANLYNTCIFEFVSEDFRRVLNKIQTEEQNHGKMIYDYMATNSMYA